MNNNNINDDKRNNDDNTNVNNTLNANSDVMDDFDGADCYSVREADPVKQEQLLGNAFYGAFEQKPLVHQYYNHYQNFNDQNFNDQNFDDLVKKAIEISKHDFDTFQYEEEEKNIKIIEKEKEKERIDQFKSIRQKLNRILAIDKANTRTYEHILTVITLYESGYVTKYNTSEEEVTTFFKLFNSIRLTNEELSSLKQIIGNE
jgi:pyruvate formate-lyase activating enzyme-like uncharacterized protein